MTAISYVGESNFPKFATEGSAAIDLHITESVSLSYQRIFVVGTGVFLDLPPKTHALIIPRSGLGIKEGITLANSVGLIDPDYRGEIKVGLVWAFLSEMHPDPHNKLMIENGTRVAQMLFFNHIKDIGQISFHDYGVKTIELNSARGEKGFGSTGKI